MSARCSICFAQTTQHLYCHTSVCTPPDCVLSLRSTGRASPCVAQLRPPHECGGFSLAESTCGIPHIHSSLQASVIKSRKKFTIKKCGLLLTGCRPPQTYPHRKVGGVRHYTRFQAHFYMLQDTVILVGYGLNNGKHVLHTSFAVATSPKNLTFKSHFSRIKHRLSLFIGTACCFRSSDVFTVQFACFDFKDP